MQLFTFITGMGNSIQISDSLNCCKLLQKAISLRSLDFYKRLNTFCLLSFRLQTLSNSFFIPIVHFQQVLLQFFQSCEKFISTPSKLPIEFIVVLLKVVLLFSQLYMCNFLLMSRLLSFFTSFLPLFLQLCEMDL